MAEAIEVRHYLTPNGKDVVDAWLTALADYRAQARIAVRINRLAAGNIGDCKSLGSGIHELRIDWGPGYRIYFAMTGRLTALLLCGGNKHSQTADIVRARNYLSDYETRTERK